MPNPSRPSAAQHPSPEGERHENNQIRAWLKRFLAAPTFAGDEDKTRAALLLHIILLTLLARAVLIRTLTWYQDLGQPPRPSFFVPFTLLLLTMLVLMRRGYVQLASVLTVAGFWLSLTVGVIINGGVHSTGFRNYIIPVLIAGLLLGRGAAMATAVMSILAGLGMWLAEINGVMPVPLASATPLELLVTHAISLLMAAVLVTLAKRNIEEALRRARQELAERRQAEETLRASEERFFKAFNFSPLRMGIIRIKDGVVLNVNDCWVREMGFAREEVIGYPIFELKNWIGEEAPRVRELMKEGQPFRNLEFQVNTKQGKQRVVLGSVEVIEINGERCFLMAGNDITERKRAEEALQLSEERFAKMFHASPESASVYRQRDGVLLEVNHRWTSVFGYTREEAIGHTALELNLVTPEHRQRLRYLLEEQGSLHEFETAFKNKQGEVRHVILSAEQIVIQGERCNVFFHRDITERKRVEEALRHNEELFRAIVEDQTEMIVRWKPDGTRTFVNQAYCRVFGGSAEEFIGSSFFPLVSEKDLPRVQQKIRSLTPTNPVATHIHESISLTGGPCWQEWTDRGIFDAAGQLVELQSTGRDITERKQAEQALLESNAKLLATSEQLRALMASLRSAKEQEGIRIAREIHDELGSALTSVRWDLEEIDKAISEAENHLPLPLLRAKLHALFGLVDATIQVVRRISSELRPSILDDLGLVAAVEWQAQQFQARTGIICQCDGALENVDLDEEHATAIFRIFQEALTNVLRHAQATKIDVSLEKESAELVLRISDNGRGISDDEKAGQFSLGLLGMRERAHLIGGEIEITGIKGQGTTVILRVPFSSVQSAGAGY